MNYIVVISGPLIKFLDDSGENYQIFEPLLSRLEKVVELWFERVNEVPNLNVITSGWDGGGTRPLPSSTVMKKFLIAQKIPSSRILEEPYASNTIENAQFVFEMLKELPVDSMTVVTSKYHMRRTKVIFEHFNQEREEEGSNLEFVASEDGISGEQLRKNQEVEKRAIQQLVEKGWMK